MAEIQLLPFVSRYHNQHHNKTVMKKKKPNEPHQPNQNHLTVCVYGILSNLSA